MPKPGCQLFMVCSTRRIALGLKKCGIRGKNSSYFKMKVGRKWENAFLRLLASKWCLGFYDRYVCCLAWSQNRGCFITLQLAIIRYTQKDGNLQLPAKLRREMQNVLDELQSDVTNELEKVSLERLADINPDLLLNIKKTAEDVLRGGSAANDTDGHNATSNIFLETRSQSVLQRSKDWEKLSLDHVKQAQDVIAKLQLAVQEGTSQTETYSLSEAFDMTSALAAAAVTSSLLTSTLERLRNQDDNKENRMLSFPEANVGSVYQTGRGVVSLDKSQFTNDGVKKKNDTVIASLYNVGLPFVSSSDGRRFGSQFELSSHLDSLFKRRYVAICDDLVTRNRGFLTIMF